MNKLANEKSAYLQHAAHQQINWHPWGDEPFEKAKQEDKPVFLSSGAIWCHWCHVMAKESFEDEEVAKIINENYVAIKLDRDEMPDIDRRYQQVIAAMGFGGGWPLSVFLTSDKKPFYGGTYFPPNERFGRPAFKTILMAIAELYRTQRAQVVESSEQLLNMIKHKLLVSSEIQESIIDKGASTILKSADTLYGGFGRAPKFPMAGAIEFLLSRYFFTRDESLATMLRKTLTSMARGGFHDHLAGGFHRYSTDQSWIVPHFEKMADDNAWLLRNYVDAYSIFGDPFFKDVAQGIINFTRNELSHPDGGFHTSQDADVTPDDEGGYFTWTDNDFKALLTDEEYTVLSKYFLHERAIMHHDSSKRVLYIDKNPEDVAEMIGMNVEKVNQIIIQGRRKLLHARETRTKPFVDTAMYSSLNGMYISAFLRAYRVLRDSAIKDFALKSLERILTINTDNNTVFHTPGIKGLLDDHIHLIDALVSAYEVTGKRPYLEKADLFMVQTIELFWDNDEGGFFDTSEEVLGTRLKGIDDTPHPSANSLAIMLLIKLAFIRDKQEYRALAEKALKLFSSWGQEAGVHGGYYFSALDAFYNGLELTLNTSPGTELAERALSTFRPYTAFAYGQEQEGNVTPCVRNVCYESIKEPDILQKFLSTPI
mgnify:FL=1